MIKIQNLYKSFGDKEILKNLNFSIKNGESICIIGKSGIGKSILLKHMIGLMKPDKGYVNIKNYCLKNNITYRRNSSNIGPELNQFEGFLEINNSEYLWILSDDDILQHNSLKVVLNILETNNLDLIFFTHNQSKNLKL